MGLLDDLVEGVAVDVVRVTGQQAGDVGDLAKFGIENAVVNREATVYLGTPVDVFSLAFSDIFLGAGKLVGVRGDSAGDSSPAAAGGGSGQTS